MMRLFMTFIILCVIYEHTIHLSIVRTSNTIIVVYFQIIKKVR